MQCSNKTKLILKHQTDDKQNTEEGREYLALESWQSTYIIAHIFVSTTGSKCQFDDMSFYAIFNSVNLYG